MVARILALCLFATAVGCSGGSLKIDGSSDEAFQASIEKIKASLTAEEKKAFEDAMLAVGLGENPIQNLLGSAVAGDIEAPKRRLRDKLDGKTRDEVLAEAEVVLAARKANMAARDITADNN
ncbi:MAG: DUF6694 family lipoprotein [Planctomycetota bacterium]